MKKLLIATLLIAALVGLTYTQAQAGEVVTYKPGITYSLNNATGSLVSKGYATLEACVAAAPIPAVDYRCAITHVFSKAGVCDPLPPPPPTPNAQGVVERGDADVVQCPDGPNGPRVYFTQTQPVRDPYPSCAWIDRVVKLTECVDIVKPWWELGGNPVVFDDSADNGTAQTDQTPGPWIEGVDEDEKTGEKYEIGDPCPEAAHGKCVPSPNDPKAAPPTCSTPEYCASPP